MSGDGNTKHTIKFENTGGLDLEFIMFKFRKLVEEARFYFEEDGSPVNNGYEWTNMTEAVKPFTLAYPEMTVIITETGTYGSEEFDYRCYFRNGKSVIIEPVVTKTWPEYSPDMLA